MESIESESDTVLVWSIDQPAKIQVLTHTKLPLTIEMEGVGWVIFIYIHNALQPTNVWYIRWALRFRIFFKQLHLQQYFNIFFSVLQINHIN